MWAQLRSASPLEVRVHERESPSLSWDSGSLYCMPGRMKGRQTHSSELSVISSDFATETVSSMIACPGWCPDMANPFNK